MLTEALRQVLQSMHIVDAETKLEQSVNGFDGRPENTLY